jgi:hypothetical protein
VGALVVQVSGWGEVSSSKLDLSLSHWTVASLQLGYRHNAHVNVFGFPNPPQMSGAAVQNFGREIAPAL